MRGFNLWRLLGILLLSVACSSCSDDDDLLTFKFNENGECYCPSVSAISKDSFEKSVVGSGWKHAGTYEIDRDGKCLEPEYYGSHEGGGPSHYYFESVYSLKEYIRVNVYPSVSGFRIFAYDYEDANRIVVGGQMKMQILSVDGNILKVIEQMGVRADGEQVYGYAIYKRMTERELAECRENYPVDLSNLRDLILSVEEERVFISGNEFEFDILDSNGPCETIAYKEETCDITNEGNHVKVKLLKNGIWITVSDRLKHRMFWLFSTDEELEPTGTDIYDFTYTELTLDKNKDLVTPNGHVLDYKYASMVTKAREEYYGSVLSRYNPSGLVVVDADKQARFLPLDRGTVYLKNLVPQAELDALAEAGDGHAIEYKLELVNAAGVMFQVLPFKIVCK